LNRKREKANAAIVVNVSVSIVVIPETLIEFHNQVKNGNMGVVNVSKLSNPALSGISFWVARLLTGSKDAETIQITGKILKITRIIARIQRKIVPIRFRCVIVIVFFDFD
jgi:hypothetical protein